MASRRRFSALVGACLLMALGCSKDEEVCEVPALDLKSSASSTATYTITFDDTTCDVIIPGPEGFAKTTPESEQCGDGTYSFEIHYFQPDRPGCEETKESDGTVAQGTCYHGTPKTQLLVNGPFDSDKRLTVAFAGPNARTEDLHMVCQQDAATSIDMDQGGDVAGGSGGAGGSD